MEVFFQLAKIMEKYRLSRQGVVLELAEYLGVHRQTVAKFLSGQAKVVNLETLSLLCQWLLEHNVSKEELPTELFGMAPAELWQVIANMRNIVLYFGQYYEIQEQPSAPARLWISRRDVDVANKIMGQLYAARHGTDRSSSLQFAYVPFRYRTAPDGRRQRFIAEDAPAAKRIFAKMRAQRADTASILLGSAEVNYLVEVFMASFWGLRPFQPCKDGRRPPVYVVFRHPQSDMVSCFGGLEGPPGFRGKPEPGLHYLGRDGQWRLCPWRADEEDAGLVVLVYDPAAKAAEAVIFGYTGRATAAMATRVVGATKPFWPPYCSLGGKQVGVYLCRFHVDSRKDEDADFYHVKRFEVIRLDEAVIRSHIRLGKK